MGIKIYIYLRVGHYRSFSKTCLFLFFFKLIARPGETIENSLACVARKGKRRDDKFLRKAIAWFKKKKKSLQFALPPHVFNYLKYFRRFWETKCTLSGWKYYTFKRLISQSEIPPLSNRRGENIAISFSLQAIANRSFRKSSEREVEIRKKKNVAENRNIVRKKNKISSPSIGQRPQRLPEARLTHLAKK